MYIYIYIYTYICIYIDTFGYHCYTSTLPLRPILAVRNLQNRSPADHPLASCHVTAGASTAACLAWGTAPIGRVGNPKVCAVIIFRMVRRKD